MTEKSVTPTPLEAAKIGRTFGLKTVLAFIRYNYSTNGRNPLWMVRCKCGREHETTHLRPHKNLACRCPETTAPRASAKVSWRAMRERCRNPKHKAYERYGGRGIAIAEQWNDFETFFRDLGPRPTGTTLDRINNDGNYEPGNCRWATWKEQSANRRPYPHGRHSTPKTLFCFNGRSQSIVAWANELKIDSRRLRKRLAKGWSIERALTEPRRVGH